MSISFRKATFDDEPRCWEIVHSAALHMVEIGRHQWDAAYPSRDRIHKDIEDGIGYVLTMYHVVVGYTAITFDGEPAYDKLRGKWLTNGPYSTIHRTAIDLKERGKGLSKIIFEEAERLTIKHEYASIRIDTNYDNKEMLGLVEHLGFIRCGTCEYFHAGAWTERICFEKQINDK